MAKTKAKTKARERTKLARLVTSLPGPKAKAILKRDTRSISPSYTRSYPLVAQRGYGALIEDVDGNTFVDFAAGIAVCATGHCHPQVVAAIQKQAGELIHMSGTDFYYPGLVELAEKLAEIVPGKAAKRVYYGNSGTEAIEAAMKLARYATGREKFIAFFGGFHGRTMGALSLTAFESGAAQRIRLAAVRGFSRAISGCVSLPARKRDKRILRRVLLLHRARTLQEDRGSERRRRHRDRADSRRRRLSARARGVFEKVAEALPPAWNSSGQR